MILLKVSEEIQNNVKKVKRSIKEKRNNAGGNSPIYKDWEITLPH